MTWKNRRVLVTGAGGFIGSHLTEKLVMCGARMRAFVHYRSDGSWGWLDRSTAKNDLEIVAGDVRDPDCVTVAMKNIDVVFHLAALIGIPYSYAAPRSYVNTNIHGTLHVLQAARDRGVDRVVHTSTSEVYGTARYVPIDESHPLQGQSPYSATKIAADKLAEAYHLAFGVPVVTVRPFNTFGPRQSARAVIPAIVAQCLSKERVVLGNLHPTRDFNYIDDVVDGFVRAGLAPAAVGKTMNIGSGSEISIGDLARLIGRLSGMPIKIHSEHRRVRPKASEVDRLIASNSLAQKLTGWKPRISLEDGIFRTLEWIRRNNSLYRPNTYVK